MIGEAQIQGG